MINLADWESGYPSKFNYQFNVRNFPEESIGEAILGILTYITFESKNAYRIAIRRIGHSQMTLGPHALRATHKDV